MFGSSERSFGWVDVCAEGNVTPGRAPPPPPPKAGEAMAREMSS